MLGLSRKYIDYSVGFDSSFLIYVNKILFDYQRIPWIYLFDRAATITRFLQRGLAVIAILSVIGQGVYKGLLTGTVFGFLYWLFVGILAATIVAVIFVALDIALYVTDKSSDWLTDQFVKFTVFRRWILISFAILLVPLSLIFIYIYWEVLDNLLIVIIYLYCILLLPSALLAAERTASKVHNTDLDEQTKAISRNLHKHISLVKDSNTVQLLEEAVVCFENKLYNAAVVLSWIGAISLLYDYVVQYHLTGFNDEVLRRDPKWRPAKTADDLARMKEYEFLNILEALSIIGKNVKQELQSSLKLRNACGHPNSLGISQNRVAAHLEILILNVFSKFT